MTREHWQRVNRDLCTALRALHNDRPVPLPVYARLKDSVRDSNRARALRLANEPADFDD